MMKSNKEHSVACKSSAAFNYELAKGTAQDNCKIGGHAPSKAKLVMYSTGF